MKIFYDLNFFVKLAAAFLVMLAAARAGLEIRCATGAGHGRLSGAG